MSDLPPKKIRSRSEWKSQEIDWNFIKRALPYGALARGIDQAGKRSAAANKARLRRGCLPGTADTYVFWQGVTCWLERKKPGGGTLDPAQEVFRDLVRANGGHWALIESTDDVEAALRAAGIPLRATLGDIRERIEAQNERLPPKRKAAARKPGGARSMTVAQYRKLHARGLL